MRHRGPDWSGVFADEKAILVHERLSIVDVNNGAQPLYNADHTHVLAVNGEIYNHRAARGTERSLRVPDGFRLRSHPRAVSGKRPRLPRRPAGHVRLHSGDSVKQQYLIGRDHIGIIPLYMGNDEHGNLYVASEMKALVPVCRSIKEFPPGSYLSSTDGEIRRYWQRDWMDFAAVAQNTTDAAGLKHALEESVKSHLMSDVPYGVLLSGGLDSSIISAVTKRFAAKRVEDQDKSDAWWPQLHSFAVGLEGSPDLKAAQAVADHLGTVHHEIHFTVQEGLDAIRDVIYHIETYDVTTIRASTPMYLMSRKIKAMGIKMVLSGEGADEVFGGYLYFHKAPNARSSTKTCVSCWRCTCLTARALTKRCRHGAWKRVCRSSTRNSLMWRCASTRKTKCAAATVRWKNTFCVNVSPLTCRRAWRGVRKSSSQMA